MQEVSKIKHDHFAKIQFPAGPIRDSKLLQANMIQQLTDYQDTLTQDLNLQFVHTMQETLFPRQLIYYILPI